MDLSPLVARISSAVGPLEGRVAVATSIDSVFESGIQATPCAFVFMPSAKAGPNTLANGISQQMNVSFEVLLVVHNVSDPRGEAAYADMDALRPALWSALGGWSSGDAYAPLESDGDRLLYAQDGLLVWGELFRTYYHKRAL